MDNPAKRPSRIQILNQFGQRQSLDDAFEQFLPMPGGDGLLLLGLGPNPKAVAAAIENHPMVAYLEAPDFERQMSAPWFQNIPEHWRKLTPGVLQEQNLFHRKALFYRPNLKLFPDFWTPILAAKNLACFPRAQGTDQETVWLPGSERGLLTRELTRAFTKAGLHVVPLSKNPAPAKLLERLRDHRPDLFFCINFQGLDPLGLNAATLRHLNVPLAVWCVDNPFHLLPALKSRFWQSCTLFVTDDWFIHPLREHGARQVFHLPLAADPEHFQPRGDLAESGLDQNIVFVGRSSFPDKDAFFAGCTMPRNLMAHAKTMMAMGVRPDFSWWWKQLGHVPLWPSQAVRQVGFATEQCSQLWRTAGLNAAALDGRLTIFGDTGWQTLLPANVELHPEVDYYGPLPDIYRQARYTLNLTSLLLPHGLTQRHFDVWTAGGFLLTDITPGLKIFNRELVRETIFNHPEKISRHIDRLEREQGLAAQLRTAWRKCIQEKHTYDRRITAILDAIRFKT